MWTAKAIRNSAEPKAEVPKRFRSPSTCNEFPIVRRGLPDYELWFQVTSPSPPQSFGHSGIKQTLSSTCLAAENRTIQEKERVIWKGFEYCKEGTVFVVEISKHSSIGYIFLQRKLGFTPGPVLLVFVVDKVAMWRVSCIVLLCCVVLCCVSWFDVCETSWHGSQNV